MIFHFLFYKKWDKAKNMSELASYQMSWISTYSWRISWITYSSWITKVIKLTEKSGITSWVIDDENRFSLMLKIQPSSYEQVLAWKASFALSRKWEGKCFSGMGPCFVFLYKQNYKQLIPRSIFAMGCKFIKSFRDIFEKSRDIRFFFKT